MHGRIIAFSLIAGLAGATLAYAEGKASRLPDLPDPPTDPILQEMAKERAATGGSIINLQLTTGHAPKLSQATGKLANIIRNGTTLPRDIIELAILRTAFNAGSQYELKQHQVLASGCKYPQAKIDGVQTWPKSADAYDDREKALLAYVDQMTHGGNVDDATFETFAKFFNPRQIVELTVTIGNYYGNGLLTRALRVKMETDGRVSSQGKC